MADPPPLVFLHRDSNLVVVDKPPDLCINTMHPDQHPVTVASQLSQCLPTYVDSTAVHGFRFVHRLDYSTSGVLCIALNKETAQEVSLAFAERRCNKEYIGLLVGRLEHRTLVDMPIGEDNTASHKMVPETDKRCIRKTVRTAETEFIPLKIGTLKGEEVTKVLILPYTGRRHQIRVHAKYMGCPVLGDYTYNGDEHSERMYLHSKKLAVPFRGDVLHFESPLDFQLDT